MRVHLRIRQLGMLARLSGHWPATSELLSGIPSIFRSQLFCSCALIAELSLMRSFISVSCSFVCRRQYCRFSVVSLPRCAAFTPSAKPYRAGVPSVPYRVDRVPASLWHLLYAAVSVCRRCLPRHIPGRCPRTDSGTSLSILLCISRLVFHIVSHLSLLGGRGDPEPRSSHS